RPQQEAEVSKSHRAEELVLRVHQADVVDLVVRGREVVVPQERHALAQGRAALEDQRHPPGLQELELARREHRPDRLAQLGSRAIREKALERRLETVRECLLELLGRGSEAGAAEEVLDRGGVPSLASRTPGLQQRARHRGFSVGAKRSSSRTSGAVGSSCPISILAFSKDASRSSRPRISCSAAPRSSPSSSIFWATRNSKFESTRSRRPRAPISSHSRRSWPVPGLAPASSRTSARTSER